MRWTASASFGGDIEAKDKQKMAMIEKTMSVKSIEWIMNLFVLIFSRVIPETLMKQPTKQIAADPVIMAEIRNNMGSMGLFQKGRAVRAPRRTPV
jgi:hypothetical protein